MVKFFLLIFVFYSHCNPLLECFVHRRNFTVVNNGGIVDSYDVLVEYDTRDAVMEGKLKFSCPDLRVYDHEQNEFMTYWFETQCNRFKTRIWVRVENLEANSTRTLGLYYLYDFSCDPDAFHYGLAAGESEWDGHFYSLYSSVSRANDTCDVDYGWSENPDIYRDPQLLLKIEAGTATSTSGTIDAMTMMGHTHSYASGFGLDSITGMSTMGPDTPSTNAFATDDHGHDSIVFDTDLAPGDDYYPPYAVVAICRSSKLTLTRYTILPGSEAPVGWRVLKDEPRFGDAFTSQERLLALGRVVGTLGGNSTHKHYYSGFTGNCNKPEIGGGDIVPVATDDHYHPFKGVTYAVDNYPTRIPARFYEAYVDEPQVSSKLMVFTSKMPPLGYGQVAEPVFSILDNNPTFISVSPTGQTMETITPGTAEDLHQHRTDFRTNGTVIGLQKETGNVNYIATSDHVHEALNRLGSAVQYSLPSFTVSVFQRHSQDVIFVQYPVGDEENLAMPVADDNDNDDDSTASDDDDNDDSTTDNDDNDNDDDGNTSDNSVIYAVVGGSAGAVVCIVVVLVSVFGVVIAYLVYSRKKIKKDFDTIGGDILLKEKQVEEGGGEENTPKFKMNADLFKISPEEIELKKEIGSGGSKSSVFQASWRSRDVAYKCFQTRSFSSQAHFSDFEKELALLSSLSHPNVIQFFGCTLKHPRVGIIMEWCGKGDLRSFLSRNKDLGNVNYDTKVKLLQDISSALDYVHSKGIIHRDLKSENILLNNNMDCKLIDFGLSRMVEEDVHYTTRIGTSGYIAPEITLGQQYDNKVDVFSFGIIVWEVVFVDVSPWCRDGKVIQQGLDIKIAKEGSFRPVILMCDEKEKWMVNLMQQCWDQDPGVRPNFETISKIIKENSF